MASLLSAEVFDADETVRELLSQDPLVKTEVATLFGEDILDKAGNPDRNQIRNRVFTNPEALRKLEAILHPRVRKIWLELVRAHRSSHSSWLLLEIPLLYETNADKEMDEVVVTCCSGTTQLQRLMANRSLTESMAKRIIESQDSQTSKIARADRVLWNDSSQVVLGWQIEALVASLAPID